MGFNPGVAMPGHLVEERWRLESKELFFMLRQVGDELTEVYHSLFSRVFAKHGLSGLTDNLSIPLPIWVGIAQALADVSGYKVSLQAAVTETSEKDPDCEQIVGHREVGSAEPTLFVTPAEFQI